jgi:hypothetical protein
MRTLNPLADCARCRKNIKSTVVLQLWSLKQRIYSAEKAGMSSVAFLQARSIQTRCRPVLDGPKIGFIRPLPSRSSIERASRTKGRPRRR